MAIVRMRPRRWLRRAVWMGGEIARDFGLREPRPPLWLRDNPFWRRARRDEMRDASLFRRLLLTLVVLGGLLVGGLFLETIWARPLRLFTRIFAIPLSALLFVLLSSVHALLLSSAKAALLPSLAVEMRRQTLDSLLLTPLRRAEMLFAMAVPPAIVALLVALAGLPVYLLLYQLGGAQMQDIALLYLLFAFLSFSPPAFGLPALSGAALGAEIPPKTPASANKRGGASSLAGFWSVYLILVVGQTLSSLGGRWLFHLLAALPPVFGRANLLVILSWPYCAIRIGGAPIEFYQSHLPPFAYCLPLLATSWVVSALHSASALSAGDLVEMHGSALFARRRALSRWVTRAALLCFLGFAWRAWVLGGDTGAVLGNLSNDSRWGVAGLLLLLGSVGVWQAAGRAAAITPIQKEKERLRPGRLIARRAARLGLRPVRAMLLLFLAACLFGGVSPFSAPTFSVLGKLALTALSFAVWEVGFRVWSTSRAVGVAPAQATRRASQIVLARSGAFFLLPMAALSLPVPVLWNLAALSPLSAWLHLFPGASAFIQRFPYWRIGALPPDALCLAAPLLFGLLLARSAYARRTPMARQTRPAPAPSPVAVKVRAIKNIGPTAALMAWITARTDNPLFTYEMRVRTRSGRWLQWVYAVPMLLLALVILGKFFPNNMAFVQKFSLLSPFHFFGQGGPLQPPSLIFADFANLLLTWQCFVLGLGGQTIGEALIARDRQRGVWGMLLLTPLTIREIFWGKVCGQTAGLVAAWLAFGLCNLVFSLLASYTVGFAPALLAWAVGQFFVAAVFVLGVGLGSIFATVPAALASLRGISTLLLVAALAGGGWLVLRLLPDNELAAPWQWLALRLLLGSVIALLLSVPAFVFAQRRLTVQRRRDIDFGDSVPKE